MISFFSSQDKSPHLRSIFGFLYCTIFVLPGYVISRNFSADVFDPIKLFFLFVTIFVFYLFLRMLSRWLSIPVLLINVFFNFVNIVHFLQYENRLKTASLVGLYFTNSGEAGEFYYILHFEAIIIAFTYLGLSILFTLLFIIYFPPRIHLRLRNIAIFVVLIATNIIFQQYDRHSFFHYTYVHYRHFKLEYDVSQAKITRQITFEERKQQTPSQIIQYPNNKAPVYVVVLGESLSRKHMGIYGYKRQTTPFMQERIHELGIIHNAVAPANMTEYSIPLTFSPVGVINNYDFLNATSIITDLRMKGYETWWITNQPKPRTKNTLLSLLINDADHSVYTQASDLRSYDAKLIEQLDAVLSKRTSTNTPLFIVLHMNGSHARYERRVPHDKIHYLPQPSEITRYIPTNKQKVINAYDNTVRYADYIIEEVIKRLEKISQPSSLFFFSDHGEVVFARNQKRILHGYSDPHKEEYAVPYLYWRNKTNTCKTRIPQEYRNKPIHLTYFYEMFFYLTCQTSQLPENLQEDKVLALGRPIYYNEVR